MTSAGPSGPFQPNTPVNTPDGTHASFIRYDGPNRAIIRVGHDTRLVDPVILRKA